MKYSEEEAKPNLGILTLEFMFESLYVPDAEREDKSALCKTNLTNADGDVSSNDCAFSRYAHLCSPRFSGKH